MPRYKMESLIRTMILNRCRRLRLGLHVEPAADFAEAIEQIERRAHNAEKQPAPARGRNGLLIDTAMATAQLERAAVAVRRWSGVGTQLDWRTGGDVGSDPGHHLSVARDAAVDRIRRDYDALQVEPDTGGHGRGAERDQADDLDVQHLEHAEPASEDTERADHGERDPERFARAGHRHLWRAHDVAS